MQAKSRFTLRLCDRGKTAHEIRFSESLKLRRGFVSATYRMDSFSAWSAGARRGTQAASSVFFTTGAMPMSRACMIFMIVANSGLVSPLNAR